MCNVKPDDKIPAEEFRTRLKLKSMRECLHDRRPQWFGHLERIEECTLSNKCRVFKFSGSFPRGRPRESWSDSKESKRQKTETIRSLS